MRRFRPPFRNIDSVYYFSINRNKKSILVKHPEAQNRAYKIIMTGDIMLENFTYGKMEKFNLSYEGGVKHESDIIYTTVNLYDNE